VENSSPNLTRGQLRLLAESEQASPQSRINAANTLLDLYGGSDRNLRLAKRTAKRFAKFIASTEVAQRRIRWAAEQLAARLERLAEREQSTENVVEDPAEDTLTADHGEPEPAESADHSLIGGCEHLPTDSCDELFWDSPAFASSRRALFYGSWGLPATTTRAEFLSACQEHSEWIRAHTSELKTRACSREKLDSKFESDSTLIRTALNERGLADSAESRAELAREVAASGPLVEFRPRESETLHDVGPELVRTHAGRVLDAIEFTSTWPSLRLRHQSL
jgi:hypothetical protein